MRACSSVDRKPEATTRDTLQHAETVSALTVEHISVGKPLFSGLRRCENTIEQGDGRPFVFSHHREFDLINQNNEDIG